MGLAERLEEHRRAELNANKGEARINQTPEKLVWKEDLANLRSNQIKGKIKLDELMGIVNATGIDAMLAEVPELQISKSLEVEIGEPGLFRPKLTVQCGQSLENVLDSTDLSSLGSWKKLGKNNQVEDKNRALSMRQMELFLGFVSFPNDQSWMRTRILFSARGNQSMVRDENNRCTRIYVDQLAMNFDLHKIKGVSLVVTGSNTRSLNEAEFQDRQRLEDELFFGILHPNRVLVEVKNDVYMDPSGGYVGGGEGY